MKLWQKKNSKSAKEDSEKSIAASSWWGQWFGYQAYYKKSKVKKNNESK